MRFFVWLIATRTRAVAALLSTLLVALALAPFALRVEQDDDVLAFLPPHNPAVVAFRDAAARFGALDVALVGVEAPDVFTPDFVERLERATKQLGELEGVELALSLTTVEDFVADPEKGGIRTAYLVEAPPKSDAEQAALRAKVLSRDAVVGRLVSREGDAVLLYVFLGSNADPRAASGQIRRIVSEAFPAEPKHWGGAPFVSTYVYDVTQRDLRKLGPWAAAAIIALVLLSFRDLLGTALALAAPGFGIALAYGLMGALGTRSNIVLGSMPILLVALGSAYPVHLLSRLHGRANGEAPREALAATLREVGPVIVASAVTTTAGLVSFATMDIEPMRVFGLYTGIGILGALGFALVAAPAAMSLLEPKPRREEVGPLGRAVGAIAGWAALRRRAVLGLVALVTLGCVAGTHGIDMRMDQAAFFDEDSEPATADAFLRRAFGGSQFVQVVVEGDFDDPRAMRGLQLLADRLEALEGVASSAHVAQIVALGNEAFEGVRRIPDTRAKLALTHSFLSGKRSVSQLIADDRRSALINLTLSGGDLDRIEATVAAIENAVADPSVQALVHASATSPGELRGLLAEAGRARAVAILREAEPASLSRREAVEAAVERPAPQASATALEQNLRAYLGSDELLTELPSTPEGAASRVARAVAGPAVEGASAEALRVAVASALERAADDATVSELADELGRWLPGAIARDRARSHARLVAEAGGVAPERVLVALEGALLDLGGRAADEGAAVEGRAAVGSPGVGERKRPTVTGLPLLYRGLSESVRDNQLTSLASALVLVWLTISLLFRRASSGLLALAPTLVTIGVIYGVMGWMRLHLDIGTSMLASLIIGAGVDYGIHALAARRDGDGDDASVARRSGEATGPGVAINALMVAAGFFVLTLGEARPLQIVGGLTAAAMGVSALATYLTIPALARRREYRPQSTP